jgi:hypothetical protein
MTDERNRAFSGMRIGRGNQRKQKKPVTMSLRPPKEPMNESGI